MTHQGRGCTELQPGAQGQEGGKQPRLFLASHELNPKGTQGTREHGSWCSESQSTERNREGQQLDLRGPRQKSVPTWIQHPAPLFPSCATLGQLLNLTEQVSSPIERYRCSYLPLRAVGKIKTHKSTSNSARYFVDDQQILAIILSYNYIIYCKYYPASDSHVIAPCQVPNCCEVTTW